MKYFYTSDLAKAVGIHPNTVRRYVDWGLLPPVERSPAGYRRFTRHHLDCLFLIRLIYGADYPGRAIRKIGNTIIHFAANGDWDDALQEAHHYYSLVLIESAQANAAANLLERWAQGEQVSEKNFSVFRIGYVSDLLCTSVDVLRNWERNGLITIPRDPVNGYRGYGSHEISRLRVIQMLSQAGYSIMSILRMLLELDSGKITGLRHALDTPRPDEDIYMASDHWITTLNQQEKLAHQIITFIETIISQQTQPEIIQ